MLRLEKMRLTEQRDGAIGSLSARTEALNNLKDSFQVNQSALKAARTELAQTGSRLAQAIERRDVLASQLDTTARQLTKNQASLAGLQEQHQQQTRKLQASIRSAEAGSNRLAVLGGEYDELKIRYDKLVRPARTPRGKFVAEVRIRKSSGKILLEMKNLADKNFSAVNESTMHKQLKALKKKHPKTLYVKIIIPEDDSLSYTEAWDFTNELHNKYDYYFQK